MTVMFLSVKNGQRSAISCGLVSPSEEIYPVTYVSDLFGFKFREI